VWCATSVEQYLRRKTWTPDVVEAASALSTLNSTLAIYVAPLIQEGAQRADKIWLTRDSKDNA
jgi:hypothetical protein